MNENKMKHSVTQMDSAKIKTKQLWKIVEVNVGKV